MPLFKRNRKKIDLYDDAPQALITPPRHTGVSFIDSEPRTLAEFAKASGNGPQWMQAGIADREMTTDAFLSEFGGTRDRFRTIRGRSFSRFYSNRLRTEYPILQTATGVSIVNSYADSLAGLRTKVVNSRGKEVGKPAWMMRPLPENPSFTFRKLLRGIIFSLLLDGNAFVMVHRNPQGEVVGLRLMDPTSCHPFGDLSCPQFEVWDGGAFATLKIDGGYTPSSSNSTRSKSYAGTYKPDQMLHFSVNVAPETLRGCSPFMLADSAVTTQIENQEFIERQFREGSHKQVIATFKESPQTRSVNHKPMSEEDYALFAESVIDQIEGSQRVALIPQPMEYQQLGFNPQEADMINARVQGRDEISISGNVPPMIAMNNREGAVSYASAGAQMSWFASQSLDPMRRDIQDEFTRICPPGCEFMMDIRDLQVGDPKTEAEVDKLNLESGLCYVNELRQQKGMKPIDDPMFDKPTLNAGRVNADGILGQADEETDNGTDEKGAEDGK